MAEFKIEGRKNPLQTQAAEPFWELDLPPSVEGDLADLRAKTSQALGDVFGEAVSVIRDGSLEGHRVLCSAIRHHVTDPEDPNSSLDFRISDPNIARQHQSEGYEVAPDGRILALNCYQSKGGASSSVPIPCEPGDSLMANPKGVGPANVESTVVPSGDMYTIMPGEILDESLLHGRLQELIKICMQSQLDS